eukprot:GHVU01057383.1.p2 GENE.GHVU01057383.1~~GHVU01057383.1.p2  ORF type:complete len:111 (-),score=4.85 GHVU01057383.1:197-529(-)
MNGSGIRSRCAFSALGPEQMGPLFSRPVKRLELPSQGTPPKDREQRTETDRSGRVACGAQTNRGDGSDSSSLRNGQFEVKRDIDLGLSSNIKANVQPSAVIQFLMLSLSL